MCRRKKRGRGIFRNSASLSGDYRDLKEGGQKPEIPLSHTSAYPELRKRKALAGICD